jgi:hypothetical protein
MEAGLRVEKNLERSKKTDRRNFCSGRAIKPDSAWEPKECQAPRWEIWSLMAILFLLPMLLLILTISYFFQPQGHLGVRFDRYGQIASSACDMAARQTSLSAS